MFVRIHAMVNEFFQLSLLSVACGATSMVLTKSTLLNGFHNWLEKRSPFLEEMLSCPWCTSHWVAAFLVLAYQPSILSHPAWMRDSLAAAFLDFFVSTMVMAAFSSITARLIYSAYKPIMKQEP